MQNSAAIHIFTNLQALAVQCVNKIDVKVYCMFILILATEEYSDSFMYKAVSL